MVRYPLQFIRASLTSRVDSLSTATNVHAITAGTVLSLCFVTGPYPDGGGVRIIWSSNNNGTRNRTLTYGPNAGVDAIRFNLVRATTPLSAVVSAANLPFGGANKWCWWGATWNSGGVNGDQLLYGGDLANPIQVVTTYVTQQLGTGATTTETNAAYSMGGSSGSSQGFPGQIAFVGVWNAILTLGELQTFQMQYQNQYSLNQLSAFRSPVLFLRPDNNDVYVKDYSRNSYHAKGTDVTPVQNLLLPSGNRLA